MSKLEDRRKVHVTAKSQEDLNQTVEQLMKAREEQSRASEVVLVNISPDPMEVQFDEVTKYPFGIEIATKVADDAMTDEATV